MSVVYCWAAELLHWQCIDDYDLWSHMDGRLVSRASTVAQIITEGAVVLEAVDRQDHLEVLYHADPFQHLAMMMMMMMIMMV